MHNEPFDSNSFTTSTPMRRKWKNVQAASAFVWQHHANWRNSPYTTLSKQENLSDALIQIRPNNAIDATARLGHTVGVHLHM